MHTAKVAALVALAALAAPLGARSETFGGPGDDVLIFLVSPPLWIPDAYPDRNAFTFPTKSLSILLDGAPACLKDDEQFDGENGWICKAPGRIKAGKHVVAATFTDNQGLPRALSATLDLRTEDKKFEYPEKPLEGEQFWCVSITQTRVNLMPKTDERCQTD